MKQYQLNYYPKFRCVAGACKHTCCAGWEMCIDEHSLSEYKNENSTFRDSLLKGINFKKAKFKSDKTGRCAFLNGDGLCEIIINLGEQKLCQVCTDHPRFRSFFSDRVQTGLGFSCEQATRDVLSFEDKIYPVLIADDGEQNQLNFIEKSVLEFRQKALDVVQDRTPTATDRMRKLLSLSSACVNPKDFVGIIKSFLSLERLDKSWTKRLKNIKKKTLTIAVDEKFSLYFEQFIVNSLYRHISNAEDAMSARAIVVACVLSWCVIQNIIISENSFDFECVVDVVRAFSAEVEYSQENLDKLFAFMHKFIKI